MSSSALSCHRCVSGRKPSKARVPNGMARDSGARRNTLYKKKLVQAHCHRYIDLQGGLAVGCQNGQLAWRELRVELEGSGSALPTYQWRVSGKGVP